jgi:ribosomal protein S20
MKNVSFDANADILHHVPTTIEVIMSRDPIDGGDLQRLLAKDFPKYRSIKDACAAAAQTYGLTSETMRCYASSGVPMRSKAYTKIKNRLTQIEYEEATAMIQVAALSKNLVDAIEQQVIAFEKAARSLNELKKTLGG